MQWIKPKLFNFELTPLQVPKIYLNLLQVIYLFDIIINKYFMYKLHILL